MNPSQGCSNHLHPDEEPRVEVHCFAHRTGATERANYELMKARVFWQRPTCEISGWRELLEPAPAFSEGEGADATRIPRIRIT